MPIGWRKRIRLGPFSINLSKRGLSGGVKVGPGSTNSRTRRIRITGPKHDRPRAMGICLVRCRRPRSGSGELRFR